MKTAKILIIAALVLLLASFVWAKCTADKPVDCPKATECCVLDCVCECEEVCQCADSETCCCECCADCVDCECACCSDCPRAEKPAVKDGCAWKCPR